MIILIIDTSHRAAQVAIAKDGAITARRQWENGPTTGRQLLIEIDEVLEQQNVSWEDIERIAVHTGPGGYSSLRAGIVTAALIALTHHIDQVPVSGETIEEMAQQAKTATPVPAISAVYKGTST